MVPMTAVQRAPTMRAVTWPGLRFEQDRLEHNVSDSLLDPFRDPEQGDHDEDAETLALPLPALPISTSVNSGPMPLKELVVSTAYPSFSKRYFGYALSNRDSDIPNYSGKSLTYQVAFPQGYKAVHLHAHHGLTKIKFPNYYVHWPDTSRRYAYEPFVLLRLLSGRNERAERAAVAPHRPRLYAQAMEDVKAMKHEVDVCFKSVKCASRRKRPVSVLASLHEKVEGCQQFPCDLVVQRLEEFVEFAGERTDGDEVYLTQLKGEVAQLKGSIDALVVYKQAIDAVAAAGVDSREAAMWRSSAVRQAVGDGTLAD